MFPFCGVGFQSMVPYYLVVMGVYMHGIIGFFIIIIIKDPKK